MNNKIRAIHMIGIGGSGMSGIAEVLLNLGYSVHGSDLSNSATVQRLRGLGAVIHLGHAAENLGDAQVVVRSSAVSDYNPEVQAARERGIPVIPRAEMLAELMRLRTGIAVAGTHGKTTTTSLTAAIFDAAGLDPTVIIGGLLNAYRSNGHLGQGEYLIAESDESDGSFLCLFPIINVVTNVDYDHVDHYGSQDAIDDAFSAFMNKVPFYGMNVICADDPGVRRLIPRIKRPFITYGFGRDCRIRGEIIECGAVNRFNVWLRDRDGQERKLLGDVTLSQPGRHNILNALAAIGVALQAGIAPEKCAEGLASFSGVGRRFELKGEKNGITIIDDYGHHPHGQAGLSRQTPRHGVPASPLLPHAGSVRRILPDLRRRGQAVPHRNLSRERSAHPRRERREPRPRHPSVLQDRGLLQVELRRSGEGP